MKKISTILVLIAVIVACQKEQKKQVNNENFSVVPVLPKVPYDYSDRAVNTSDNLITLGRVLFYDKNLSANGIMACATCHKQDKGFADNVQFHTGVNGKKLTRNTISITGPSSSLFWDERANSLTQLALMPIQNHNEMVQNIDALVQKLNAIPYYAPLCNDAFGSDKLDAPKIASALAGFCSVLSPLRTSLFTRELTPSESNGSVIFESNGKCSFCHNLSSSMGYHPSVESQNIGLDLTYNDKGMGALTNNSTDDGKFKAPNLKNVALTAPYMHDGRFNTLEEVVEHYNSGIKPHTNLSHILMQNGIVNKDTLIPGIGTFSIMDINPEVSNPQQLNLTAQQKKDLVAFLKALSDPTLAADIRLSNPFVK